jgi:hypothetical protein
VGAGDGQLGGAISGSGVGGLAQGATGALLGQGSPAGQAATAVGGAVQGLGN